MWVWKPSKSFWGPNYIYHYWIILINRVYLMKSQTKPYQKQPLIPSFQIFFQLLKFICQQMTQITLLSYPCHHPPSHQLSIWSIFPLFKYNFLFLLWKKLLEKERMHDKNYNYHTYQNEIITVTSLQSIYMLANKLLEITWKK